MSSRLFMELRERQGLCYDVHSLRVALPRHRLLRRLRRRRPRERGREAAAALIGEMSRLREGVPEEELRKAKELAKGRLLLRMEDTRSVSGWLGARRCSPAASSVPRTLSRTSRR